MSSSRQQPGVQSNEECSSSRQFESTSRLADATGRLRNEESWVEISSQPSSSSLSSIGDEIVTTGLRVSGQQPANQRRRRVLHNASSAPSRINPAGGQMSTSSQEEYEDSETESDDDRVMTSSNENVAFARVPPSAQPQVNVDDNSGEESDNDDENATALGTGRSRNETFTPQPNAFSHPPSHNSHNNRNSVPGSYFPRSSTTSHAPSFQQRQSYPGRARGHHGHHPYNAVSPSHDHDAALRASLTTLLSCAAAARGLPKRNQNGVGIASTSAANGAGTGARPAFTGLRLVPESELTGASPAVSQPPSRTRRSPSVSDRDDDDHTTPFTPHTALTNNATDGNEKGKRKAMPSSAAKSNQKKKRLAIPDEAVISPTLLTWVVSAGVVVLASVVGFGAGYAMGREVGRQEGMSMSLGGEGSCAKEAGRSVGELRGLRFGNATSIVS